MVIDNFSRKIKSDHLIDNKTDILLISNNIFGEDDICRFVEERCSKTVDVVTVTSLAPTKILKRLTYNLFKSGAISPKDTDVQLFNKPNEITMGSATLTNIVTAILANNSIDEVVTKVHLSIKSLIIEREICKGIPTMLLTCNTLIKLTISSEAQMLLDSLSVVGIHGIPVPSFIIKEIEKMIPRDSLKSECSCFKELENFSFVRHYPYPCMYGNEDSSDQCIEFYYIPKLICSAVLEQNEEGERLLNMLMVLKAIEMIISERACDKIKLELMLEILKVLYNFSSNDQLLSKCCGLKTKIAYIMHSKF